MIGEMAGGFVAGFVFGSIAAGLIVWACMHDGSAAEAGDQTEY